jgi:hypothetical protein
MSEIELFQQIMPFATGTGMGLFGTLILIIGYRKFMEEKSAINRVAGEDALLVNLKEEIDRLVSVNKLLSSSVVSLQQEVLDLQQQNLELKKDIQTLRAQLADPTIHCATCPYYEQKKKGAVQ